MQRFVKEQPGLIDFLPDTITDAAFETEGYRSQGVEYGRRGGADMRMLSIIEAVVVALRMYPVKEVEGRPGLRKFWQKIL